MQDEAAITVNGTRLTDSESRVIRLAMASFADILANEIVLKNTGHWVLEERSKETTDALDRKSVV